MSAVEKRVGFGPRLGAYLIDWVVMYAIQWIIGLALTGVLMGMLESAASSVTDSMVADPNASLDQLESRMMEQASAGIALMGAVFLVLFGLAGSIYYVVMEGMMGATVGKMALGLKIADQGGNAKGALMKRAIIKASPYLVGLIGGFLVIFTKSVGLMTGTFVLLGLASLFVLISMFMALRENKQALYDSMAGTAVFKKADIGNVSDNV